MFGHGWFRFQLGGRLSVLIWLSSPPHPGHSYSTIERFRLYYRLNDWDKIESSITEHEWPGWGHLLCCPLSTVGSPFRLYDRTKCEDLVLVFLCIRALSHRTILSFASSGKLHYFVRHYVWHIQITVYRIIEFSQLVLFTAYQNHPFFSTVVMCRMARVHQYLLNNLPRSLIALLLISRSYQYQLTSLSMWILDSFSSLSTLPSLLNTSQHIISHVLSFGK